MENNEGQKFLHNLSTIRPISVMANNYITTKSIETATSSLYSNDISANYNFSTTSKVKKKASFFLTLKLLINEFLFFISFHSQRKMYPKITTLKMKKSIIFISMR